jgi:hypothetical protein
MHKISFILFFTFLVSGFIITACTSKYSKEHHEGTGIIKSNLYRECFLVYSGGVLANNSYSYYLTDSANFRKYIGTVYFDDEQILCKVLDTNRILVYNVSAP